MSSLQHLQRHWPAFEMSVITSTQLGRRPVSATSADADSRKHLVVVGNGPVSFRLLNRLSQSQACKQYRITVFGEEDVPAYDRVHLTDYFSGRELDEFIYRPAVWYQERGIKLLTGQRIVVVDRDSSAVVTHAGETIPYDKLVLATGSRPFVPEIPGVDLPGVFVYRTIVDVQKIKSHAASVTSAVVLGGGLLGLEAARALMDEGVHNVQVVQNSSFLMSRQLNPEAGELLRKKVERIGLGILLNSVAKEIIQHSDHLQVRFKSGQALQTRMIVIATGIRPRDELAVNCDLDVGARGGIIVNDQMQTSDPRIFACGECACHKGIVYGLVAPGFQMADVVADQLLSAKRRVRRRRLSFQDGDLSSELKLMGVDVAALGESLNPSQGHKEYTYRDHDVYRQITVVSQRLVGAMYVGEWDQRHLIRDAVSRRRRVRERDLQRFQETGDLWKSVDSPPLDTWPAEAVICNCTMTTKGEIEKVIRQTEGPLADAVREETGASTVCGSCAPLVGELCGLRSAATQQTQYSLLSASVLGLLGILVLFVMGPAAVTVSVQANDWFDEFLQNDFWKQVTGYSLLGVTALATVLSVRKRWPRFQWGNYMSWRALHGWLAVLSIAGVYCHTGFRTGSHLNFFLFATFVSANLIGPCTGVVTSLETSDSGRVASACRSVRPWMTWIHIIGVWPLPVLILFHILAAYFYN